VAQNDDPHGPYKLYEGDVLIDIYRTRAEARRAKQQLEIQAAATQRLFTIKDKLGRVVL
jgi:hypothetical protein